MAEWKLPGQEHVSTAEFHAHRERAPHLEQWGHKARLYKAAEFVQAACIYDGEPCSVSDLGCGDGGLLSIVQNFSCVSRAWGYDFQPSNEQGWRERGVTAYQKDVFGKDWTSIELGRITVTTEVLEHLQYPHGSVKRIANQSNYMVASSPYDENDQGHDECHSWAWDMEGYRALFENNGWVVQDHVAVDTKFQVLWAVRR
jgi:hypothetical protein